MRCWLLTDGEDVGHGLGSPVATAAALTRPEQVAFEPAAVGRAVVQHPVGGDDVQSKDALACRPERRAVPAVPALQKIAAEANAFAMAGGKEQSLCVQFRREDAGDLAGPDVCDHPIGFHRAMIEAADVQQQAAIA